ncbi:hypothetical protein HYS91_05195 [Candidatus Daviesbacteria bacterium]|nr:hypothetical protein [Candidatus Daviesbacteria bacterium]
MNPILWLLLLFPKRFRKYAYAVLFVITLILGLQLLSPVLERGDSQQVVVIVVIIGIFLLSYWYGWKEENK